MALNRLIDSAFEQDYAIINVIELTPQEIFVILSELRSDEMKEFRTELRTEFMVYGDGANIFEFFGLKKEFVDKWVKQEYTVTYRKVNLRLLPERRETL